MRKNIKTYIIAEELMSLIESKSIDFYENDNIKIQISGKSLDIPKNKAIFINSLLDMDKNEFNNLIDIIERYNHPEYYNDKLNNE